MSRMFTLTTDRPGRQQQLRWPLRQAIPDLRHKRFVRVFVEKRWRYYKNFFNALRAQNPELFEWLCVNEPGFSPLEVLNVMRIKAEKLRKD